MSDKDSLAERLNRLAQQKREEMKAESQVHLTEQQVNDFICNNARDEYEHLLQIIASRVDEVNKSLDQIPPFQFQRNGPYVKQGNSAAFLSFHQAFLNAGPIHFRLSFGREPGGFYADEFSEPPSPERYALEPAMEKNPDHIVWSGDLGEMSSEQLCDFILQHLTEYYLEHTAP